MKITPKETSIQNPFQNEKNTFTLEGQSQKMNEFIVDYVLNDKMYIGHRKTLRNDCEIKV